MAQSPGVDPLAWLAADREQAVQRADPCANLCTLATVDPAGHPQARTVILRDLDRGLAVFLNETSPKWQQIGSSPSVAVTLWLPSINVQYRLQCRTRPVAKPVVHASWQMRPEAPKRLDWFYTRIQPQSSPVESRSALQDAIDNLQLREPLVAPRTSTGIHLDAFKVERLNLSMPDGLHDRRCFLLRQDGWHEHVLVP
jgi:pyridoxamine 5'-phosphate oxidase